MRLRLPVRISPVRHPAALASLLFLAFFLFADPNRASADSPTSGAGSPTKPALAPSAGSSPSQGPAVPADEAELGAVETARRLKAKLSFDPLTGCGFFDRAEIRASFALGVPWILLDQSRAVAVAAPRAAESGPVFPAATVLLLQKYFGEAQLAKPPHYSVAAILIDPGHGGKDPGAVGEHLIGGKRLRVVEKDLALDIGLRLYNALKARFPDRRILITRTGDSYPTLEERVALANSVELSETEAIIYVSIHANASFNKNARGFEVWYLNPEYRRTLVNGDKPGAPTHEIAPILNAMLEEEFTTESIILAKNISAGLQKGIGNQSPNRGIRAEEWFVVRNARMPSVLVETGFVTSPEEAVFLSREDYLQHVAEGIYNGISDFVGYFESMKGAPPQ